MAAASTFYDREYHQALAPWLIIKEIGRGLRECYQVLEELPPELLVLVGKLDNSDWLFP